MGKKGVDYGMQRMGKKGADYAYNPPKSGGGLNTGVIDELSQQASQASIMTTDYRQNQLAGQGSDYFGGKIKNFISDMAKKVMGSRGETPFSHIY